MENQIQLMIYENAKDLENYVSLDKMSKRIIANYKTYRTANPHLEPFEVWRLLSVEVYGCDADEGLIKESWDEYKASMKKVLGKKRFKKRKK